MGKYYINACIWFLFALFGAYILNDLSYSYFAGTIAIVWLIAAQVVIDIKKEM